MSCSCIRVCTSSSLYMSIDIFQLSLCSLTRVSRRAKRASVVRNILMNACGRRSIRTCAETSVVNSLPKLQFLASDTMLSIAAFRESILLIPSYFLLISYPPPVGICFQLCRLSVRLFICPSVTSYLPHSLCGHHFYHFGRSD